MDGRHEIGVAWMTRELTRTEAAELILRFLEGSCSPWEWDDFTSVRYWDPVLESARERCVDVRSVYPPENQTAYCGPRGVETLRELAVQLREPVPGNAGVSTGLDRS
jgi:hypothetical protein